MKPIELIMVCIAIFWAIGFFALLFWEAYSDYKIMTMRRDTEYLEKELREYKKRLYSQTKQDEQP